MRKMVFQSVTKGTWKKRVEPINDLVVTSLWLSGKDTLPLGHRTIVGAEANKLQQVFVTNALYIVRSRMSICARENNGT